MQHFPPLVLKKSLVIRTMAVLVALTCMVSVLAQTVFAQNTYVINDGDQTVVHTTYASNPARVLSEAGFALDEDDFYTTAATEGGAEITVQRAMKVTVNNCGQSTVINSYGETVQELLNRTGVSSDGEYSVSVALKTPVYDGMQVDVTRTVNNMETYVVEIPYETNTYEDPTLPAGEEKVIVEGVNGQTQYTAKVVYANAQEQSRTVVEETVLESVVNKVVAVGTGKNVGGKNTQPIIGNGVIVLPTGEVLTYTGKDQFLATAYTHTDEGCNMTTATGTTVRVGTVAVDPTIIPYGTRMFIVCNDGSYIYGLGTAEDCGGAIQGKRLDLYFPTNPECMAFGRRDCTVYFLGGASWNGK